MKSLYRLLLLVCASAAPSALAAAQITITAADVATQLGVGNTLINNADTTTTSVNIGVPGLTSWNFSGLLTHTSTILTSVSAAGSPFIADFPGATHALKTTLAGSFPGVPGIVAGDLYLYLNLGTHLETPGSKGSGTVTIPPFLPLPATLTITNVPADTTYALPATLGTVWRTLNTTTTAIVVAGAPFSTTVVNHDITYTVDAYGFMTIPGGGSHEALRIRKVENAGTPTVGYIFLAKNGATVQLTANDLLQPDNGTIAVQRKSITWSPPTTILPIQLAYFSGSYEPGRSGVVLRWGTVSELNNFGFEVQRGSTPNGEFQTIGDSFIPGHGTTNVPQEYAFVDKSAPGGIWYYRLSQIDLDGSTSITEAIRVDVATGVREETMPAEFSISQNYPNPFNPSTTIRYGLPYKARVTLVVYNALGQEVATLVSADREAGYHEVRFDASGLTSGGYFYRLTAGDFMETKKLLLLK